MPVSWYRFRYKEDYELFKLYVTLVTLILASVIWFFVNYRSVYLWCCSVSSLLICSHDVVCLV